jgi:hypothetical protein
MFTIPMFDARIDDGEKKRACAQTLSKLNSVAWKLVKVSASAVNTNQPPTAQEASNSNRDPDTRNWKKA